jgi:Ca2+:H+ antiporter
VSRVSRLRREWPLAASLATTLVFFMFGERWLADLGSLAWFGLMLGWLFGAILVSAFAVVRHAEALAEHLREPLGTLVLTLSMSGMEMMMITAVMYAGSGESSLARDTMLAIVMLVLNGLVGACLLLGGLRYHEQTYNIYGANAFLAVILPMAVLGLILPSVTVTTPGPTLSPLQAGFLIVMSIGLYSVFLAIQMLRHRDYFVSPESHDTTEAHGGEIHSALYHGLLLLAYVLPIVLLAKKIAAPIDYGISVLGAPAPLGGLLVAVLILSPESLAAVRAALANRLQRSINPGARHRALEHQPDDPGGAHHRVHHRPDDHPRPRADRGNLAGADPGDQHRDVRPRAHQRPAGRGARAPLLRLSDADLRELTPIPGRRRSAVYSPQSRLCPQETGHGLQAGCPRSRQHLRAQRRTLAQVVHGCLRAAYPGHHDVSGNRQAAGRLPVVRPRPRP